MKNIGNNVVFDEVTDMDYELCVCEYDLCCSGGMSLYLDNRFLQT
jgi:hypothetical protein